MTRSFGTILKEIRRSKNISQRKLAEEVGVDFLTSKADKK